MKYLIQYFTAMGLQIWATSWQASEGKWMAQGD